MTRAVALGALLALGAAVAAAQDAPSLWREARDAEDAADPARALAVYQQLVNATPSDRLAGRARRRIAYLQARAEGGFGPLQQLMRVRRDQTLEGVAALEVELEGFPAGLVRQEGRALVAASWLRMDRPTRAATAYRALLEEPGLPDADARRARQGLARSLQAAGDPQGAMAVLAYAGEGDGELAVAIEREGRTRVGSWIALGVLALFVLGWAWGTGLRPLAGVDGRVLGLAALVLGGPLLIAHRYDSEASGPFLWLALASAPVLVAAAALGHRARGATWRALAAVGVVAAELAVAYLVLVERGGALGLNP